MMLLQNKFKYALLLGAFFLKLLLFAQNNALQLLPGTEKIIFNKKDGIHRLIGTVNFTYQGNTMYCDSAHYQEQKKIVHAYGNVQIKKNDINLFCDSLRYNGNNKFAKLWGHVRIRDNEYKLASDSLDYDAKSGRATYRNNGKIESIVSNEMITSKYGYFYPNIGSFFFSGKVKYRKNDLTMTTDTLQFAYEKQITQFFGPTVIKNDSITIKCDRGWYNVKTEEGKLMQRVSILQKQREIFCDTAFYRAKPEVFTALGHVNAREKEKELYLRSDVFHSNQGKKITYITGHALAIQLNKGDSLFLHADTLSLYDDSLGNTNALKGNHHVRIFSEDIQCLSDSAYYDYPNGKLSLFYDPVIWAKNTQLKGDTILAFIKDSVLTSAFVLGNASALMEIDSGKYYNQLSGRKIVSNFSNNEMKRADIQGNAWTIFYPIQEEKNDSLFIKKRMGLNRLYASDLRLYLDSGEIVGVTYFDEPDGIFYPMDQIKEEERFIQGFSWKYALRPKSPQSMIQKNN
jgi:lipopolysaccharide export system protein LptA